MGFAGNLRTLALPEVLQTLNRIKATGVLRLAAAEGGRDVVFNEGELIGIAFRRGEERQALLRRLILDGRLDAATAAQISHSGRESQIVARLIEQGAVEQDIVRDAVQRQAEEELQSLFTWDFADFVFHDAGPEAEEINGLVEAARGEGLNFNINSLLMESARRQDEWERVKIAIPDGGLVLGPREGQEAALQQAAAEYPASAVIPLVDAVRSVDDVVKDSVATRLDVYASLAQLMEQGLVVPLTRDDIIYHADFLASKNDLLRASSLYRRALAARPSDQETARKLADCLAKLGDAPEAAACYAQLAIGSLNADDPAGAVAHARRAVQMAPKDPSLHQTLVRCLLAQDPKKSAGEAVGELLLLIELFLGLDRLEDARSTCLQVLEIDKGNEPARRQLARIFSAASQDEQSEDVVMCIQCGHVNHREAATCEKCQALLQLTCLACGRVVGVSDKLCIFCGADPHRGASNRRASGSPATSRIANPDKVKAGAIAGGAQAIRDKLDELVAVARGKEQSEDWEGALTAWREVATLQVDNADLNAHIRRIETLVHDTFVESQIEKGHQFRRVRRYWAAISCYKAALRTMPSDDPRAQRLVEILGATQKVGTRIALVYVAAIVLIGVFGILIAQPMLRERKVRNEVATLAASVEEAASDPGGARLAAMQPEIESMAAQVDALGENERWRGVRLRMSELSGSYALAMQRAASHELSQVDAAIDARDLKKAEERLSSYLALYKERSPRVVDAETRIKAERRRRDDLNARIQDAPRLFAAAQATEASGRLGAALGDYRGLAESPATEVAAQAKAAVGRLGPKSEAAIMAVDTAIRSADALRLVDLAKAETELAAVAELAAVWNLSERIAAERQRNAQLLAEARVDAARLGPDASIEAMAEFLKRHPGAPEAAAVRKRHGDQVRAQEARAKAVARYRQLIEDKQWEVAWGAARDLVSGYGAANAGDIRLPLVIETVPVGATVRLDGKVVGPSPAVLAVAPGQRGEVAVEAPGWQPVSRRLEDLIVTWRWAPVLSRAVVWRADLGKAVGAITPLPSGELLAGGTEGIAMISSRGQVRWRVALGGDDLGGTRRSGEPPSLFPDGRMAVALAGSGVNLIDPRGGVVRYASGSEVRGRPLAYINEVFGATPRLAYAADAIYSGEPGAASMSRIPLPAAAISGPVAMVKEIDRILVVADVRGRLVGIEESTKRQLWELNVLAADVGQLIQVSDTDVVAVLDGVRLACFGISARDATLRWTHQLEAPAVGEPVFADGVVHIASGPAIVRVAGQGTVMPSLALPAPASSPVAAAGNRVAAGCSDGTLHLFVDGALAWSSPLGTPPTAVGLGRDAVYAAAGNGAVAAFAP